MIAHTLMDMAPRERESERILYTTTDTAYFTDISIDYILSWLVKGNIKLTKSPDL